MSTGLKCWSAWQNKASLTLTMACALQLLFRLPSVAEPAAGMSREKVGEHNGELLRVAAATLEGVQPMTFVRGSDYEEFDILSRAVVAAQVKRVMNLPEPRAAYLNRPALEAVVLSDHFGDFSKGDDYSSLVSGGQSLADPSMWNYMLKHLRATGRARESKLVEESMKYEFKQYANIPQSFPDQSQQLVERDEVLSRHAGTALKARDISSLTHDASTMLQLYKERPIDPFKAGWGVLKRQDLLCTVLDIARRLSDLGYYDDSNNLLNHLEKACQKKEPAKYPASLVDFERLVNADRLKKSDEKLWFKVLDEIKLQSKGADEITQNPTIYDYPISDSLRMLALTFYNAGEISRAKILIFRALKQFETEPLIEKPDNKLALNRVAGWEGNRIILNLDAACIMAKLGLSDEAYAFSLKALNGPALVEVRYGFKIAELAQLLQANGRVEDARSVLEEAHAKLIDPKSTVPPAIGFLPSSRVLVDYALAKLLIEEGEVTNGRTTIEKLVAEILKIDPNREIKSIENEYQYSSFVLAGDAALTQHDFNTAARRYRQASDSRGGQIGFAPFNLEPVVFWLQKAIACAEQSSDFPSEELANFYAQEANLIGRDSPTDALRSQDKCVQLLSDSNPEKVEALSKMAAIQRTLPKPFLAPEKTISPRWHGRVLEKRALTPKEREEVLKAHPEIAMLKRAAALAEMQKDQNAYQKYREVADAEAQVDLWTDMQTDLAHAISLYHGTPHATDPEKKIALIPMGYSTFYLMDYPDHAGLKKILHEAESKVESCDGANSPQCKAQLFTLFKVLFYLDDISGALNALDRILEFEMKPSSESYIKTWVEARGPSNSEFFPIYSVDGQPQKPTAQTVLTILTRTLDAQKRSLPKDDAQIFQTKLELAKFLSYSNIGKTGEAPALFKEVLDFLKMHVPEDKALLLMPKEYLESIGEYKPDLVFPPPDKAKRWKNAKPRLSPV